MALLQIRFYNLMSAINLLDNRFFFGNNFKNIQWKHFGNVLFVFSVNLTQVASCFSSLIEEMIVSAAKANSATCPFLNGYMLKYLFVKNNA